MSLAELYRDPVYDGATDPVVVIADGQWWMFYTQRRATHPDPGPGVAWVHGSRIGVARSVDGAAWEYAGTLEPRTLEPGRAGDLRLTAEGPASVTSRTHWAPEVVFDGARWRMYLTEIDGVPDRWPGHEREIVEYRSSDLSQWQRVGALKLESDRVIDAGVARTSDGRWRLWYKDEAADSVTKVAVSDDLETWTWGSTAVGGRPHEGPCAFELGGWWWMIVDEWRGMAVHRSRDGVSWARQGGPDAVILGAGEVAGPGFGHHGAAVRDGDRTWFYFFGHPRGAYIPDVDADSVDARRSAIYRVGLRVERGELRVSAAAG
ncbi:MULTISPECIES: hypothetical protein [unclassified Microbacterium]|uniref:hypothetical protein n=1 Tax=unclassified Microbacterium TaxID=2609290 RepID=UPI0038682F59